MKMKQHACALDERLGPNPPTSHWNRLSSTSARADGADDIENEARDDTRHGVRLAGNDEGAEPFGSTPRVVSIRRLRPATRPTYFRTFVTLPAPTVLPPSRMAKPRPSSMAMGWISSTVMSVVSPGMTISVPSGSVMTPVTSVVRK